MEIYIIQEKDELLRRVPRVPSQFKSSRITSAAFKPKSGEDGLSVNILKFSTIDISIIDPSKYLAAIIIAESAMDLVCECVHNSLPENYALALIKGILNKLPANYPKHVLQRFSNIVTAYICNK